MRKFLMATMLVGVAAAATAVASSASAAPRADAFLAVYEAPAVQPVQYYEDWRYREWRRHQEYERWRRHQWRRHHRYEGREYGRRGW